ncbi:hypothetical protein HQQ81_13455 [Microbacteriaceae bacterium VKM Ac-2854]|nr:hypothetical protein [Microbacteriaceae bacterium VKM Ac-2854]
MAFAANTPFNPWASTRVTGTWASHASYSLGGIDYPLAYGTDLVAPADGNLRISGGSGEFAAGWVGSAGRRSVLELDAPINRVRPAESSPPEAAGPMVAIVFQHQSAFGTAGHKNANDFIGKSGASANNENYGGDIHLHVHGLDAQGRRLDVTKFITGQTVPAQPQLIDYSFDEEPQDMYIRRQNTGEIAVFGSDFRTGTSTAPGRHIFANEAEYNNWRRLILFYNQQIDAQGLDPRGKRFVPPTPLTNVMGVSDADWATICGLFGV